MKWAAKTDDKHWKAKDGFALHIEKANGYWMWWVNDTLETVADGRASDLGEAMRKAEAAAQERATTT